eukprot:GSMAST32.ASY1.ANO1.2315.1 assembled CDS
MSPTTKEEVANVSPSVDGDEVVEDLPVFQLDVLATVKMSQLQNGMRNGNHARYRTDIVTDKRHLLIPLMNAERAWSYAMELKQELIDKDEPRKRFHMLRRLRKAVWWANQLKDICTKRTDDRTSLEAAAYAAAMTGLECMEREQWAEAHSSYSAASHLYEQLGKFGLVDDQDLYQSRVQELTPSIKYCQYILARISGESSKKTEEALLEMKHAARGCFGAEHEMLAAKLEMVMAEARKKQAASGGMSQVMWRGQKVRIRQSTVQESLLGALEKRNDLTERFSDKKNAFPLEEKLSVYVSIFSCYDDALKAISKDKKNKKTNISGTSAAKEALKEEKLQKERTILIAYLKSQKSLCQNENSPLKITKTQKNQKNQKNQNNQKISKVRATDLVRMYDILLQNISDISKTFSTIDEMNDTVQETSDEDILTQEPIFRVMRCFYTALLYGEQNRWPEAFALFERCESLVEKTIQDIQENKNGNCTSIKSLLSQVHKEQVRCRAEVFMKTLVDNEQQQKETC